MRNHKQISNLKHMVKILPFKFWRKDTSFSHLALKLRKKRNKKLPLMQKEKFENLIELINKYVLLN
jgi:hypothetical protein